MCSAVFAKICIFSRNHGCTDDHVIPQTFIYAQLQLVTATTTAPAVSAAISATGAGTATAKATAAATASFWVGGQAFGQWQFGTQFLG